MLSEGHHGSKVVTINHSLIDAIKMRIFSSNSAAWLSLVFEVEALASSLNRCNSLRVCASDNNEWADLIYSARGSTRGQS